MKFILGKKLNMSQIFNDNGQVVPVTVIKAGPCKVTQVKTADTDGYQAVQIGFDNKKKLLKPLLGHLKGLSNFRYLKEFRLEEGQEVKKGQEITVGMFEVGDKVKVTGVSKGKGFQGVVKRHGFHGSPASHGHKDQLRMPGSIGATDAARVFKGTRMGGRTGTDQVTLSNLEIVKIEAENNLIYIKGAVPGARNSLVWLKAEGELKEVAKPEPEIKESSSVKTTDDKEEFQPEEKTEEAPKEEVKEDQPKVDKPEPQAEEKPAEDVKEESDKKESSSAKASDDKEEKTSDAEAVEDKK